MMQTMRLETAAFEPFFPRVSIGRCEEDRRIYQAILSILYTSRRRMQGIRIGIFQLERMLEVPEKFLEFTSGISRKKVGFRELKMGLCNNR